MGMEGKCKTHTQNDTTYFIVIHAYFRTYFKHIRMDVFGRRVIRVRTGEGENTQRKTIQSY